MDKQAWKKTAAKCKRRDEVAEAGAFMLVGVDREVTGMGDGCALLWTGEEGKWKMRFLNMVNADATYDGTVDIIDDDDLYDDELDEYEDMEEQEEAADCRVMHFRDGASVRFLAHVNRTGDGLHVREDFVSRDRGDGPQEIPIAYWNTGRIPVKVDGVQISPGGWHISLPTAPSRLDRKDLKRQQDECLAAQIERYSREQAEAKLQAVVEQVKVLRPDWTEEQVRRAAELYLAQEQNWALSP